ncbi:hypothetical protein [Dermatobacter hominis]|uniref:hypothetical protein n=1 Tax=Dermatobacter hominis TaxID=2884263 RepID=UPI001D111B35|nr:hypothetical protein [Dermatobacter hominis]UDY37471.1 hypothetical protein LH044_07985 [Dermatobacter hominis]
MTGRLLRVAVQLLDRQIVDRDDLMAGKVDDVELTVDEDGAALVAALISGPGVLAGRLGHRRYGRWRERMESTLEPPGERMTRIPMVDVRRVDSAIHLSIGRDRLASMGTEHWVRDHVICHLPAAGRKGTS